MKITWLNKRELKDKGYTKAFKPPTVDPETDEISWGTWVILIKHKGKIVEIHNDDSAY